MSRQQLMKKKLSDKSDKRMKNIKKFILEGKI